MNNTPVIIASLTGLTAPGVASPSPQPLPIPSISPPRISPSTPSYAQQPLENVFESMQSPSRSPIRISSIGQIPQLSPTIPSATPAVLATGVGSSITRKSYGTPEAEPITQTQSQFHDEINTSVIIPTTNITINPSLSNTITPSVTPYQETGKLTAKLRTVIVPRDSALPSTASPSSIITQQVSPLSLTPSSLVSQSVIPSLVSQSVIPSVVTSTSVRRSGVLPRPSLSPGTRLSTIGTVPSTMGSTMKPTIQQSTVPQISNEASNIQFASPEGMIENQDILRLLSDRGYMPFRTTLIQGTNGMIPKYVKAINDRGNTVYVMIDMDGNIMTQPGDLTTIETTEATSVPLSVKMGAYNCAGLDVCAVALECDDGICMLMRDDDTNMKEVM